MIVMLIKESQLLAKSNILDQLNEAVYLTQEEASLNLSEIPVVAKENGSNMVDYMYAAKLSEDNGYSLLESIKLIKESNDVDNLILLVDEGDAIAMQEAFDPDHMMIKPLSEDSNEVFWCDFVSEAYLNDEIDEDVFTEAIVCEDHIGDLFNKHVDRNRKKYDAEFGNSLSQYMNDIKSAKTPEEDELMKRQYLGRLATLRRTSEKDLDRINAAAIRLREYKRKKREAEIEKSKEELERLKSQNPGPDNNILVSDGSASGEGSSSLKYGAAAAGAGLAGYLAYKQYKNKPKSVIGKRIAALRKVYTKFMKKAQSAKDSGIANKLKKVAAKILSVIDKLLEFLQKKAG
jgi:hypothetical protein